ncbi:type IV pilus modification PilV family protein [Orenia marismortui]|uniref:Prepilin-type N-terminal cleavage/methylation domain-containing protein n=1 Tax=Orenia marismortui TaxID=46469 RepID=A0A4R8H165_9FIRM|nr:prepilin-type N-terminal cleavage/methylation domain-containing protein [Orenia marismortui]TDX53278.1 prepilin-type N-terminal cleavage/methylation domain-containing protein [Orenia marismortui]
MKDYKEGFTLIEVLIAMVILGVGFSILIQGFMEVNDGLETNKNYTYVSSWAESKLKEIALGIDLNNHGTFQSQSLNYRWSTEEKIITQKLKKLILRVQWQEDDKSKSYSLSRYILEED